jgi:hypothetical protein
MLGDCYAAAIVEHLSKEQLMAADAAIYEVRTKINFQKFISFTHTKQFATNIEFLSLFLQY